MPNQISGFNLSLKEILFESVDRHQTMMYNCLSFKLPRAFGSGDLKSIKFMKAYMMKGGGGQGGAGIGFGELNINKG